MHLACDLAQSQVRLRSGDLRETTEDLSWTHTKFKSRTRMKRDGANNVQFSCAKLQRIKSIHTTLVYIMQVVLKTTWTLASATSFKITSAVKDLLKQRLFINHGSILPWYLESILCTGEWENWPLVYYGSLCSNMPWVDRASNGWHGTTFHSVLEHETEIETVQATAAVCLEQ